MDACTTQLEAGPSEKQMDKARFLIEQFESTSGEAYTGDVFFSDSGEVVLIDKQPPACVVGPCAPIDWVGWLFYKEDDPAELFLITSVYTKRGLQVATFVVFHGVEVFAGVGIDDFANVPDYPRDEDGLQAQFDTNVYRWRRKATLKELSAGKRLVQGYEPQWADATRVYRPDHNAMDVLPSEQACSNMYKVGYTGHPLSVEEIELMIAPAEYESREFLRSFGISREDTYIALHLSPKERAMVGARYGELPGVIHRDGTGRKVNGSGLHSLC